MRIGISIAMPRKMFCHRNYPNILHSLGHPPGSFGNIGFIFAKCTEIDNRIVRIGVDIGYRGKIHVNSHHFQLSAKIASHLVNVS